MKLQFTSLGAWLLVSLVAHFLLGALVLQQRMQAAPPRPVTPPPLQISTFSAEELQQLMRSAAAKAPEESQPAPETATPAPAIQEPATQEPITEKPITEQPAALSPPPAAATARPLRQPVKPPPVSPQTTPRPTVQTESTVAVKAAPSQPVATTPTTTNEAPAASQPLDLQAILQQTQRYTAQRPLTATELNSLSHPKNADAEPSERQRKERAAQLTKSADMPADVLEVLADGTQRIKIGDNCALAAPGADLRKDIHSIKVVPCGENNRAASRDALFEQIMSKVGKQR